MAGLQKFLALIGGRASQVSPVQASAGAASAGAVVATNAGGLIDPSFGVLPTAGLPGFGSIPGYGDACGALNATNLGENNFGLNGWRNYFPFRWEGPLSITSATIVITGATSTASTLLLSIMQLAAGPELTTLATITASAAFNAAVAGVQTLSAPAAFAAFDLPPGDYVMQMVATGATPTMQGTGNRRTARGGVLGFTTNGSVIGPVSYMLDSAGATALASTFSGTPNGGYSTGASVPLVVLG